MKYEIICDVAGIDEISLSVDGHIVCNGTLQVSEYNPGVGSMTLEEIDPILGSIFMLIFLAWGLGELLRFAKARYF